MKAVAPKKAIEDLEEKIEAQGLFKITEGTRPFSEKLNESLKLLSLRRYDVA